MLPDMTACEEQPPSSQCCQTCLHANCNHQGTTHNLVPTDSKVQGDAPAVHQGSMQRGSFQGTTPCVLQKASWGLGSWERERYPLRRFGVGRLARARCVARIGCNVLCIQVHLDLATCSVKHTCNSTRHMHWQENKSWDHLLRTMLPCIA